MTTQPAPTNPDGGGFRTSAPISRRMALAGFASIGAAAVLAACGSDTKTSSASSTAAADTTAATTGSTSASASTTAATAATATAGSATADAASCVVIPEETAGPYPGDGSNGPNVLSDSGIVRKDIRSSYGSATGTAEGTPLTIELVITDTANGCVPMPGAAVYAWHCDANGEYSLYSGDATSENYLRGVQEADADGVVTFTSIFPGAYSGRWPHIHFEVYPTLAAASDVANKIATSQIALPQEACDLVYADSALYPNSSRNMTRTTLSSDNVFSDDDGVFELATTSGSVADGFTATLAVGV